MREEEGELVVKEEEEEEKVWSVGLNKSKMPKLYL